MKIAYAWWDDNDDDNKDDAGNDDVDYIGDGDNAYDHQ